MTKTKIKEVPNFITLKTPSNGLIQTQNFSKLDAWKVASSINIDVNYDNMASKMDLKYD